MKEKIYFHIVKMITVILIFTCFSFFTKNLTAQQADKWHDSSDELEFGSDNTILYIALGAVAAGLAVWYFAFKDSGDDKKEKGKTTYGKNNTGKDSTSFIKSDSSSVKKTETVK